MNRVVIGVGSNIAPEKNIEKARKLASENFSLVKESELLRTAPLRNLKQEDFLNGAWLIETELDRVSLNNALKKIEDDLGRDRTRGKWAPREIDLDIVVWNGCIVDRDYFTRDFLKTSVDSVLLDVESEQI